LISLLRRKENVFLPASKYNKWCACVVKKYVVLLCRELHECSAAFLYSLKYWLF
jgi:hypothetical protein